VNSFIQKRIITPVFTFLKQGITPHKLALSIALGFIVALFPVLGATTLLCALLAWILRLNMPAIQLINYIVYPLQFIFFLPFIRLGEFIFNAEKMPFSIPQIYGMFKKDLVGAIDTLWWTTMHAIVAWLIVCPLIGLGLYFILHRLFEAAARKMQRKSLKDI
jgi:uncharacterized protein (DUF2062 family)